MNNWHLNKNFILASASPQRIRLLENAGFHPEEIDPADINEEEKESESPTDYVQRISKEKALFVAKRHSGSVVLGADTIVYAKGHIIRKAENEQEARNNLNLISGTKQEVITGYAIVRDNDILQSKVIKTLVETKEFSNEEIDCLIQAGEWKNVAGYRVEGMLSALVKSIQGSYWNIVGLPIYEISEDLKDILK